MSPKTIKRASIKDVAREAGVSVKTVSRVLNNEKYVRQETKSKVDEAVARMGYRPNLQARGLASNRSYMVGLLIDNTSGDYISKIQAGILRACEEEGSHLVVELLPERGVDERVRDLLSRVNFDGVVLTPPVCDDPVVLSALHEFEVPSFRIGGGRRVLDMGHAEVDDYSAALAITNLLIEKGHRDIGFVKGDLNHDCSHNREQGFIHAMQEAGLRVHQDWVLHGTFSLESGEEIGREILELKDRPTAFFVSSDIMAAGVASVLISAGIRVPEEVSLVGFDDDAVCTIMIPHLTTIRQPVADIAHAATLSVIEACKNKSATLDDNLTFEFQLIERQSVLEVKT